RFYPVEAFLGDATTSLCTDDVVAPAYSAHRHMPDRFDDARCRLCQHVTETVVDHFFFTCPSKQPLWQRMLRHHHCSYNFQELNAYCHTLDPPRSKTTATIPPHTIIIAVHLIWASHWRYIFDDTPFDASRIYNMISTKEAAGKFTWGL
ncbi:hypothetical protein BDB00DRAFT_845139, partial [Zychaea mexicana]|uniref:uncharacterized protein n=1 Tax=Zychaea mexicana TaxID=64656 RepID=UPI0022FDC5C0